MLPPQEIAQAVGHFEWKKGSGSKWASPEKPAHLTRHDPLATRL